MAIINSKRRGGHEGDQPAGVGTSVAAQTCNRVTTDNASNNRTGSCRAETGRGRLMRRGCSTRPLVMKANRPAISSGRADRALLCRPFFVSGNCALTIVKAMQKTGQLQQRRPARPGPTRSTGSPPAALLRDEEQVKEAQRGQEQRAENSASRAGRCCRAAGRPARRGLVAADAGRRASNSTGSARCCTAQTIVKARAMDPCRRERPPRFPASGRLAKRPACGRKKITAGAVDPGERQHAEEEGQGPDGSRFAPADDLWRAPR